MIRTDSFNYDLPERLIAQQPLQRRDLSRLLVMDRDSGKLYHQRFYELPELLSPGDCLVLNNSKVLPARLLGVRADSGAAVEILLLRRIDISSWEVIVRPGRKVRTGHRIEFLPGRLYGQIRQILPDGNRIIGFEFQGSWENLLDEAGRLPLPPYIHEQLNDDSRYQTVYARSEGSAAAPTAGLHFTPRLLDKIRERGIRIAELTLHVGLGTFRPVKSRHIDEHKMHAEYYELDEPAASLIRQTQQEGKRIVAVGTTSCRVLESIAERRGSITADSGWTDIFIYPGYRFRIIDALVTNFHLPESTLIMLVSAFAGRDKVLAAYKRAVQEEYRFFSFGDAMLIMNISGDNKDEKR